MVISKLVEAKNNIKYLIGDFDKVMSGYGKTFKEKNNKLIFLHIHDDKLIEKYKTIWTKIEDLKDIELNALPVYDDGYIKAKIKTYGDKNYASFRGLNVPEGGAECESFTVISIGSLLAYENKYYLQVYLDNCANKIVNTQIQMIDYLRVNLFDSNEN